MHRLTPQTPENTKPRVLKFGGTSVHRGLDQIAHIVRDAAAEGDVVVVVSALAGVTTRLVDLADGRPDPHLVRDLAALHGLRPGEPASQNLERLVREVGREIDRNGPLPRRGQAALLRHRLLATGERLAAERVTRYLRDAVGDDKVERETGTGVDAVAVDGTEVMVAHLGDHREVAEIDLEASARRARRRLACFGNGAIPIVTGFVAGDGGGRPVTLGRGSSDLSATVLARLLGADRVEIWTDVDGIWSADPHRVEQARPLRALGYAEAEALARWGARILHPAAVAPAAEAGIPIHVRSTFDRDAPGTRIGTDPAGARACVTLPAGPSSRDATGPEEPGPQLVWVAALGVDPGTFVPLLPDDLVIAKLVEPGNGAAPDIVAYLVPQDAARRVELAFHRAAVERDGVVRRAA